MRDYQAISEELMNSPVWERTGKRMTIMSMLSDAQELLELNNRDRLALLKRAGIHYPEGTGHESDPALHNNEKIRQMLNVVKYLLCNAPEDVFDEHGRFLRLGTKP